MEPVLDTVKLRPLPWRDLVLVAALASGLAVAATLAELSITRETNGWLVHSGPNGPAAALMREDLPDEPQFARGEHDGPMFYAIAANAFDLQLASRSLDRPQYRLQRPLYPWLSRVLYPPGHGAALVWSMFLVGTAGVFLGALSMGSLAWMLGARPIWGLAFGLLPGTLMTLRISAADTLSTGLLLAAFAMALRGRRSCILIAVLAVLSKETALVSLAGFALWRRDRQGALFAAVPAAVAVAWGVFLRFAVPAGQGSLLDVTVPFAGLIDSARLWLAGDNLLTLVCVPLGIVLALVGSFRAGLGHPLSWPALANLLLVAIFNLDVVGLDRNGTRTVLPLLAFGIVLSATASSARRRLSQNTYFTATRLLPTRGARPEVGS